MGIHLRLLSMLFVALILTIIPLPEIWGLFRPPWVLLWVLMTQFYFPRYVHVYYILLVGLCLDVLLATPTGEHSFALVLTAWLASGKIRRFRFYTMSQQIGLVTLFCVIYQALLYLIDAFLDNYVTPFSIVCPAVISVLLWPWVVLLSVSMQKKHSHSPGF